MKIDSGSFRNTYGITQSIPEFKPVNSTESLQQSQRTENGTENLFHTYQDDRIVNSSERKFFVNLFPDSSRQIMSHEIFTRTGKVQNASLEKGTIFDGRI